MEARSVSVLSRTMFSTCRREFITSTTFTGVESFFAPGVELILKDSVFSQSPETRNGTLWFNVAGDFRLERSGERVEFSRETSDGTLLLSVNSQGRLVEPVRGQTNPMRGWRSQQDRKLEPVWSVGYEVSIDT